MSPDRLAHMKLNGHRWKCKLVSVSAIQKTPALIEGLQLALKNWNDAIKASGIDFAFSYSESTNAQIVVHMESLPEDVIGLAQPPNGDNYACHCIALNSHKPFGVHKKEETETTEGAQIGRDLIRNHTIDIVRVLMHELGHAIGLKHIGVEPAIMHAEYTKHPNTKPTPEDLEMVRALYA